MLARVLRVVLVALAAGSLAVAWALGPLWDLGPGAVVLIAVALFFAVPAGMILATFAVSWRHRSVPPSELRIGPLAAIRCVLHEIFSYTAAYYFLQPFPRLVLPAESPRPSGGRPVVVLVHGYACNAGVWAWFARYLLARGHTVRTVTLEPLYSRIDDYAALLAGVVSEAVAEAGSVVLVAHSMGGLVCRAYARWVGGAGIARIITLGTPHHGSMLAPMGHGADALDMWPQGEWLRRLRESEESGLAVPITSIYSVHDNFVAPQESSVLAGAKNVPVGGIGHLSLLFSAQVAAMVDAELSVASGQDHPQIASARSL